MITAVAILYLGAAVGIGAVVWRHTRGTWTSGTLGSHVVRRVLITIVTGAMWPGAVLVAAAYRYPAPRTIIDRLTFGPNATDNT